LDLEDEQGHVPDAEWCLQLPPYNGFGDELDSQQNCKKLIAHPPKKDLFK